MLPRLFVAGLVLIGCGRVGFDPVDGADPDPDPGTLVEACDSGEDEDGDGTIDCADKDCVGFAACPEWCEAGVGGTCYYIDPAAGDDASDGSFETPWRTHLNLAFWYDDGGIDPRTRATELVPGDAVYFRAGSHDASYTLEGKPRGLYLIATGSADASIRLSGYPGEQAVFENDSGVSPLSIASSSYLLVEELRFEAQDADGFVVSNSDQISVQNASFVSAVTDGDMSGLKVVATSNVTVRDSHFAVGPPVDRHAYGAIVYQSSDLEFHGNEFERDGGPGYAGGILANDGDPVLVSSNVFRNLDKASVRGRGALEVVGNIFEDSIAVHLDGLGIAPARVSGNTFVRSSGIIVEPDPLGSAPTSIEFSNNVVVDGPEPSSERGTIVFGPYQGDVFMTELMQPGVLDFQNNCYFHESAAVTVNFFAPMGGTVYSFAEWQGLGYDTGSLVTDPKLDANLKPAAEACVGRGASQ